MKKLKLKIQDLENPSILTHREIKNIMGGDAGGSDPFDDNECMIQWTGTYEIRYHVSSDEANALAMACPQTPGCISVSCMPMN